MKDLKTQQYVVLVQRHLELESRLADALDEMNQAGAEMFRDAGVRGPKPQDLEALEPMMQELQRLAKEVAVARTRLLDRINQEHQTDFTRIKLFIRTLPDEHRKRLTKLLRSVLNRSNAAQSTLIHNQAVLYYTFDFHRKYLAGVLQNDVPNTNYGADGQSSSASRGNILGKSC